MATQQARWTREQLIVTLDLYCRTPFGRLHRSNPDVVALAEAIGRTPSAVAMKLVNFASFDPIQQKRGIHGLSNAGKEDRLVWQEFQSNWSSLALAGATIKDRFGIGMTPVSEADIQAKHNASRELELTS